jgi:hypothetical protein
MISRKAFYGGANYRVPLFSLIKPSGPHQSAEFDGTHIFCPDAYFTIR